MPVALHMSTIHLVYNSPSLKLLCATRIRQSISRMGRNIENNLIEKLTAGDFDDLRDPNVPISLADMCKYLYWLINLYHELAILK